MRLFRSLLLGMTLTAVTYAGEEPPKKVCVTETKPKTLTHTKYKVKRVDVCLPSCGLFGPCGCDAGGCGKVREVRRLIKRLVKEEACETVCHPVDAPACPAPCGEGVPAVVTPAGR